MEVFVDLQRVVKKGDRIKYLVHYKGQKPRVKTGKATIVYPHFVAFRDGTATYDDIISINGVPYKENKDEVTEQSE